MEHIQLKTTLQIPVDSVKLSGDLFIPDQASSVVVFSHGSGSSRHSSRNQFVARQLQEAGFATLLFDLLTEQEDQDYHRRFDIDLLAQRLIKVTEWLNLESPAKNLTIGYFGASTGAAAALIAGAELPKLIKAIVSRGGRPDLAAHALPRVEAATLLIVGGFDYEVITMNEQAFALLKCHRELAIVEDASHLFEEPGKLVEVATLAKRWFQKYL